jgi:hypothetical protein
LPALSIAKTRKVCVPRPRRYLRGEPHGLKDPRSSLQRNVALASLAVKAKLTERNLRAANIALAGRWRNLVRGGVLSTRFLAGFFCTGGGGGAAGVDAGPVGVSGGRKLLGAAS